VFNAAAEPPAHPPFRFDTSAAAIQHNSDLIERYNYNIELLLANHSDSSLGHGSEFRNIADLAMIYGEHPLFPFFATIRLKGMNYDMDIELTEQERMVEVDLQLRRGNHKSAALQPAKLRKGRSGCYIRIRRTSEGSACKANPSLNGPAGGNCKSILLNGIR
jgi:hypothetical protein